jgi:hypothetical protein
MLLALRSGRALLSRNIFSVSGAHFCLMLRELQGLVLPEGLGKLKKKNHLIGSRTREYVNNKYNFYTLY